MGRRKGSRKSLNRPQTAARDEVDIDYRKGASANLEDLGLDSEDDFHDQREKISFDENVLRGLRDNEDELSEEEVFGLDIPDSDDEDEDEALLKKFQQNLKKGRLDSDEEGEDDTSGRKADGDEDDLDIDDRAWGKSRKIYYDADEATDEEDAKAEEEEALRLQRLRASQLRQEDFLDEFDDSFAKRITGDSTTQPPDSSTLADDENDIDHLGISASLPLHLLPTSPTEVEVVSRDANQLPVEELVKIAESRIPEIVQLLSEFEARWKELRETVGPALSWQCRPEDGKIKVGTARGREYLELKYRILSAYLTNIAFYLSLRANPPPGINVKAHPVVGSLVRMQELLDRLETKVEGRVASDSENSEEDSDEDTAARRKRRKRKRKQQRRDARGMPELMAVVEAFIDNGDAHDLETIQTTEDEMNLGETMEKPTSIHKQEERKRKVAKKTDAVIINGKKKPQKKRAAMDDIEIPAVNYNPVGKIKKSKTASAKAARGMALDFGESNAIDEVDLEDKMARKKSLRFHVTRVDQAIASRKARLVRSAGGDEDIPYRDRNGKLILPEKESPAQPLEQSDLPADIDDGFGDDFGPSSDDGMDEDEEYDLGSDKRSKKRGRAEAGQEEEEDPEAYYESVKQAKRTKMTQREREVLEAKRAEALDDSALYDENDLTQGTKRPATWRIMANKGLTPHRRKEQRNPRVKKRQRYEKAQKRLGSFKRIAVDKSKVGAYAGEKTGIKANLARSVKFT